MATGAAAANSRAARIVSARATLHAGRLPDEVDVVRIVEPPVDGARLPLGEVRLVGLDRANVGLDGVLVATDAPVDVGRHVDEMACPGHERRQSIRRHLTPPGIGAAFDGVDVQVERARMGRIRSHHPLQGREDLRGLWLHAAVRLPQVPRPEVHEGVGEERGGVEVVGKAQRHLAHRVRVRAVERRALGARCRRVALRERLDGCPLPRRHPVRPSQGLLDRRVGRLFPLGVGRAVVVRPLREGDAPVAHRARRIEARRLAERGLAFDVVEGVDEPQALIEVRLGLGRAGGDALVVAPEALEDHRRRGRGWPGVTVGARLARAARERDREEADDCVSASTHFIAPSVVNASVRARPRPRPPEAGAAPLTDPAPCATPPAGIPDGIAL